MATIRTDRFAGIMPRLHPSVLPEGCATVANNLLLKNGKIVPLAEPSSQSFDLFRENGLSDIANAKTMFAWRRDVAGNSRTTILAWPGNVSVARSNIASDDRDRIFVSGATGVHHTPTPANEPCVYFNNRVNGDVCRRSLIKEPLPKVVATPLAPGEGEDELTGTDRYTVFFQTWVDKYGYESPVSEASDTVTYKDGQTVRIAALAGSAAPDSQAVARRVYKTITGETTADNRFVAEFRGADAWGAQDISVYDKDVGEVMPMVESPPADLHDVIYVPGGYYAGASTSLPKTVLFSDVSMPYSWPTEYQYDIHDNIVALATSKNTVFALTDNRVWILRGTGPDSMVASALSPAACVSRQSVVEYNNNVFFASPFGYCMVHNTATDGDVVTNFTDRFFTREQWQNLNPSTCRACQVDGRIMAFFEVGGVTRGYVIDLNEKECMLTTHDVRVKAFCVDTSTDRMYFKE